MACWRLERSIDDTARWLDELGTQYDRIWVIMSGTHPYFDLRGDVEAWLRENSHCVQSSLATQLYATLSAKHTGVRGAAGRRTASAPDRIWRADPPGRLQPGAAHRLRRRARVRLYWQVLTKLGLAVQIHPAPDGTARPTAHHCAGVHRTRRTRGIFPRSTGTRGIIIMEYVEFPAQVGRAPEGASSCPDAVRCRDAGKAAGYPAGGAEQLPDGVMPHCPPAPMRGWRHAVRSLCQTPTCRRRSAPFGTRRSSHG